MVGGTAAIERRILEAVREAGDKGILQRELWRVVGIDSRNGARIVRRLEQRGFLVREAVMYKGRRTYVVRLTKKALTPIVLDPVLVSIPCFTCPMLSRCGEGAPTSPVKCERLNRWLAEYVRKLGSGSGDGED